MYNTERSNIKSVCLNNFIDQTFQLLDDILLIVPHDNDILTAKTYISTIKRSNPKLIIASWHECVTVKYKKEIDDGDFEFALKNNYETDLLDHYQKDSENHMYFTNIIQKLRNIACSLDENNKQILTKYIQNLSNLSIVYFEN